MYDCDPEVIRSGEKLKEFVDSVCKVIDMTKFGDTMLHHFGHGKPHTSGYSLVQFIETSAIVGHFSELRNSAYINIFSCKPFSETKTVNFTKKFFGAKKVKAKTVSRD